MEIEVGSKWEEKVYMGEVVTVTGRYLNLDTNQVCISYEWFGEMAIQDIEKFRQEFRPSNTETTKNIYVPESEYNKLKEDSIKYQNIVSLLQEGGNSLVTLFGK